jgi:hypothetical protein
LKLDRDTVAIDQKKIEEEERFDDKLVLKTKNPLPPEQLALK